jgi:hypothetical protein
MPHTYKFADAACTTVVRDDGATFPWPPGDATTPGAVGAALGGFVGEDYRTEGCPQPAPFGAKDKAGPVGVADVSPKFKLRGPSKGKKRKGKYAKPVDADMHPPPLKHKPASKPKKAKKAKKPTKHGR